VKGKFVELLAIVDKRTGAVTQEKPHGVKKGEAALVLVEAHKPVCVEPFKDCPPLGRFAIRDIGNGILLIIVLTVFRTYCCCWNC
jgi:elongation factor 1-alpha